MASTGAAGLCPYCLNWLGKHADDCPERPIAREVLRDMRERIREATKEPNPAWLIECGHTPVTYYCDEGDWCSNPNHAWRFPTKDEASAKAATMRTMEPVRVAEHVWS